MNAILEQINTIGKSFVEFALPMLAQFSILFLILLLIDFLLRKKVRTVFRYWIWMLVLAKLVLPTSLSSPLSLGYLFGDSLTSLQIESSAPQPQKQPPAVSPQIIDFSTVPPAVDTSPVVKFPTAQPAPKQPVSPPSPPPTMLSWQGIVFLLWLAVVIAMALLLLQRAIFVSGLVAQAVEADDSIKDTFNSCCERMGVKKRIGLKVSTNATSPAVCGLFSQVILLPQNLSQSLSAGQLQAVLLHELAHIKRGDLWVNLAQTVLQILYFYNPLLWITNAIIRRIREQAVDEMVLVAMGQGEALDWIKPALGGTAQQYSQTLVSVAKLAFKRPVLSLRLIGVVESQSALASRIKRILSRPIPKNAKLGIVGILAVIVIAAILLPMAKAKEGKKEAQPKMGFVATLPNGVAVEMVGVCDWPKQGKRCWRPDGSELTEEIYTTKWNKTPGAENCGFMFKFDGPDDLNFLWDTIEGTTRLEGSCKVVDAKGNELKGFEAAISDMKEGQLSITIRIGVAAGPWTTIATHDGKGIKVGKQGDILWSQAFETNDGTHIVTSFEWRKDRAERVVAIYKKDNLHITQLHDSIASGKVHQLTSTFRDLKLNQINEFQYQTRPYQWATFKNVSLKPNFKTDVQVEGESPEDLNKKIEELIGVLKDFKVGDREKWFSAVKELIEIGSPAVKPLSIEIRTAERPQTQSVIAFTLRAIGDSNAIPALIDALERSGFSSDYGVGKADTELSRFIRRYQVNPSADGVRLCRPVREITIALERLTDHTEGHEHFITIGGVITPELRDRQRAQYREVAQRWRQWWQQQKKAEEYGALAAAASEGSLLEFHIVPDTSQGEWLGLTPEDISKYKGSLSTEGPFAGSIRGEAYQWYSIKEDLRIQPGFIVQEYKGKKYLLFCARQKHSIWPPIGTDRSWGLQKVYAIKDSNGRPAIGFEFDKRGGELFYELTKGNIGKTLAVIIDGEVVSTPMIMSPLQNEGTVVGDFTQQEVERMVEALRKGMPSVKPDVQVEVEQSDKTSESSGGGPRVQEPNEIRGRIRGVVVNSFTDKPVEGAYVGVGDFGDSGGSNYARHRSQGFFAKSETDPNGRFELDGLAYSDEHPEYDLHHLVVTHPDFVRYDEKIKLTKGEIIPDVRVSLRPAAKINVTVVDSDGKPLEGLWLFRLEAIDGRYFIPPGRDPHLSAFASSVWIEMPKPVPAKKTLSGITGFSFTGLSGGEYSIDVMQFAIIDNYSPPPSGMVRLPLDTCNITYYGGITKLNVEAAETKEVQIKPADYQTSAIIKMPEDPVKKPEIPPFVVISRNVGLLAWDDGKAHGPEDERLGRLEKNALYYNTVIDGNVLKIKNLPPGSYSVFAGPIYFMSSTKMEVLGGGEVTVDVPAIKVSEHAKVGLWTFNRKVKPEERDYSVPELCQLINAKTDSNPRLIPDPSIENQKIKLTEKEMSIWDVLEMIYLDKGWKVKEGGEKTLILQL